MYGWVWRKLPGPWPVRALEALGLTFAVCALLVVVVFPWIEPKLPFSDNVVDGSGSPTQSGTPTPASTTGVPPATGPSGGGALPGDG